MNISTASPRRSRVEHYTEAQPKRAAVMSCGKNSGCWKTDGQQIPWELPDAPVNIIHRRLATGSVVDQMNAHPFAELHTALTHNGETTNYRTMLNRDLPVQSEAPGADRYGRCLSEASPGQPVPPLSL